MSEIPTKPYLIRAIYEWCVDSQLTPHLAVKVDEHTRVPQGYVKDGEIILNINITAVRDLQMQNDFITFNSRFNGAVHNIVVPVNTVTGIFARENGQGMAFPAEAGSPPPPPPEPSPAPAPKKANSNKPAKVSHLKIVK